jgi:hypothetical protein
MMLLPFTDDLVVTWACDPEMAQLADRHYSRRTPGKLEFIGPGKKLAIRNSEGSICFAWLYGDPAYRLDGQQGYNCTIFRNESGRRSSEIILECERIVFDRWGPNRVFTYVDPRKIQSRNPGYCFKCAGWKSVRRPDGSLHRSQRGYLLLAKHPL